MFYEVWGRGPIGCWVIKLLIENNMRLTDRHHACKPICLSSLKGRAEKSSIYCIKCIAHAHEFQSFQLNNNPMFINQFEPV